MFWSRRSSASCFRRKLRCDDPALRHHQTTKPPTLNPLIVLPSPPQVRLGSNGKSWSDDTLNDDQLAYAALDVIKPIEVFEKLLEYPDLELKLSAAEAVPGLEADLGPASGSGAVMATRAAKVTILDASELEGGQWTNPIRESKPSKLTSWQRCTV